MDQWIQTYSGQRFFFEASAGESNINIIDIARSLSRIQRFNGHAQGPISVAEHSCAIMDAIQAEGGTERQQLYGLMDDAHEAFMGDLTSPFIAFLLGRYNVNLNGLKREIQGRIYKALEIPTPEPAEMALVERADLWALATERKLFMQSSHEWHTDHVNVPDYIPMYYGNWGEDEAQRAFEKNYERLMSVIKFAERIPLS